MIFPLDGVSNYATSNDLVVRYLPDLPDRHTDENEDKVELLLVKETYRREVTCRVTIEPKKPIHVPQTS